MNSIEQSTLLEEQAFRQQCAEITGEVMKVETVDKTLFAYGSHDACQQLLASMGRGMSFYSPYYNVWVYTTYEERVDFIVN